MWLYEQYVLPHFINMSCGSKAIQKQREKIVPLAEGRVLEIGMGSGLNIPFYNSKRVDFVWGLEPSKGMRKKAHKNLNRSVVEVRWLDLPGEKIPLDGNSADTVLLTYTLCTISDWNKALQQMCRVIKPGGKLLFCEHGAAIQVHKQLGPVFIESIYEKSLMIELRKRGIQVKEQQEVIVKYDEQ